MIFRTIKSCCPPGESVAHELGMVDSLPNVSECRLGELDSRAMQQCPGGHPQVG
jgi:hypothetical protein